MLHHCHGQSSPPHPADAVDPNSPLLHTSALQKLRVLTLFLSDYLYCSLQTAQCIFEDALFCWAWTGRCKGHHSSWTGDCSTVRKSIFGALHIHLDCWSGGVGEVLWQRGEHQLLHPNSILSLKVILADRDLVEQGAEEILEGARDNEVATT